MPGNLVISLDFELLWGVRDHSSRETYGANVLGGRTAIPAILELFASRDVHATWAVVGAVLCESKDELLTRLPADGSTGAAPLTNLDEIGDDERHDPYHFGASLARLVASCPGQELGTHTFSHVCALEPGHSVGTFRDDVGAAVTQLKDWGVECRSIVFPRNQYGAEQLDACRELGLTHFRGNEASWFYAPAPGADQTKARRLCRLLDSYVDLSGPNVRARADAVTPLVDVPASRFLRPYHRKLRGLDGWRLRRIETAMAEAAATGGTFHLWWHPENFGRHLDDNMSFLAKILDRYARLRDESGMASRTMSEMLH